jgi:IPTL-CTERM motif
MLTLLGAAAAWADPAGTAGKPLPSAGAPKSAVLPSIEILSAQTNLASTCGGQAFNINTYINVDSQSSAEVRLSAPGFPTLEQFTDETGSNIGPFSGTYATFNIQAFGGGLAPNTSIRITINTYSGHALAGSLTYTSTMQYNCTTGTILNLVAAAPGDPQAIPALSDVGLAATALLLALAGLLAMRRRAAASSSPN